MADQQPGAQRAKSNAAPQPETFTYHEDPGHGWLEVPFELLVRMGIERDISGFSYRDGARAYLEEDMDATTFLRAYAVFSGITSEETQRRCRSRYREHSFVRELPRYWY